MKIYIHLEGKNNTSGFIPPYRAFTSRDHAISEAKKELIKIGIPEGYQLTEKEDIGLYAVALYSQEKNAVLADIWVIELELEES